MSDLIERLRAADCAGTVVPLMNEAADALEQSQSRIEELITEATRAQYMSMKRRIRIEKLEAALERAQDLLGKTMSAGIRLQARIDELEAEIETPANDGK